MTLFMTVRIQTHDFDLNADIAQLHAGNLKVGAVVTFVGTVRDFAGTTAVSDMLLEHYPGMTEKVIDTIVAQAETRWNIVDALVVHRVGRLQPGDRIVLVAVTAMHRGDAFSACEFIIDYLKTQAPFWKKEQTPEGSRWVDARAQDDIALLKWNMPPGQPKESA
jgi:molybdopterin synthase catalytic subunit